MIRKTFIWLSLITMVVAVAIIIWQAVTWGDGYPYYEFGYDNTVGEIQNAVTAFTVTHNGSLPPYEDTPLDIYDTYSNTTITCHIFDICSLISVRYYLTVVPESCYGSASQAHTNFYNSSDAYYNGGCKNPDKGKGHYIWLIDSNGSVFSICDENRDGVYNSTERVNGRHLIGKYTVKDIIWP